ncbi:MAG TPA: hypothetical protein PK497_04725 [Burkholderiaceae bacterium]|nr:hypothetical protein [Burkholderiaceae bacterium]
MTTTTGSSANFRAPIGTNEALNNTFRAFAREATELAKALLQPGKFVEEVVQMRALQAKEQSRQN